MEIFMENQVNKRKELKYTFKIKDYSLLKRIILKHGYKKNHSNNFINNLYFDNDFSSYDENIEGVSERIKYRLRWYDGQNIFFEEKIKKAGIGFKNRIPTAFNKIEDLDYSNFKKLKCYEPVVQNRYLREYFINSKGIRITLDSMIKYEQPNSLRIVHSNINVMEIKSPVDSLPDKDLLNSLDLKLTKYSKYVNGSKSLKNKYGINNR
jgi:hypothetical protein